MFNLSTVSLPLYQIAKLIWHYMSAHIVGLILHDFGMYQVIRKAYSCLSKWLPQDSTSFGKRFSSDFCLRNCTEAQFEAYRWGPLGEFCLNRPHSSLNCLENYTNVSRQIRKCAFSGRTNLRAVWALRVRWAERFQFGVKVCDWAGAGVCVCVYVCVYVCVCAAADTSTGAEEERSGRRLKRSSGCTVQSSIK